MTQVVFFTDFAALPKALSFFPLKGFTGKKVPVKLHMGEKGNPYFVKPELVKGVITELLQVRAKPFLLDTTVAYHGSRYTKTEYLNLAKLHGFTRKNIGCNVVIDDKGISTIIEGRTYEVAEHLKKRDPCLHNHPCQRTHPDRDGWGDQELWDGWGYQGNKNTDP